LLDHTEDEDNELLRKIKALSIEHKHFISRDQRRERVREHTEWFE